MGKLKPARVLLKSARGAARTAVEGAIPQADEKVYQDVWIKGVLVKKGVRDSEERCAAILQVLESYKRPFTVLDIGANEGYFSNRIASRFDAVAVMIEKRRQLLDRCLANESDRVILLQHQIRAGELKRLAEVGHFDVVLGLNVLHHFGLRWRTAARAILDMGDTVFIENPPDHDTGSRGKYVRGPINRFLDSMPHRVIAETKRRRNRDILSKLRLYEGRRTILARPHHGGRWAAGQAPRVESDRESKRIRAAGGDTARDWIPGINLQTFHRLGGAYPTREFLRPQIEQLLAAGPPDLAIWDLVLRGHELVRLDRDATEQPNRTRGHRELLELVGR